MRVTVRVSVLLAAMGLLAACGKQAEPEAVKPKADVAQTRQQEAFAIAGELLTVNVDGMAQAEFLAKLGQLTGSQIHSEGNPGIPVTVHVEQASLRKVLSLAIADAPYSVTMKYTNLQDSFPASVMVTRYGGNAAASSRTTPLSVLAQQQRQSAPQVTEVAPESTTPEEITPEVDFETLPEEEKMSHFLSQPEDDQVTLIFDMEPTAADAAMMAKLLPRPDLSKEVKMEMMDSLSNGEYADTLPALKVAVDSTDTEIATKAVETIQEMGDEKDIPMLREISEGHPDENVRQAAKDAIEMLE